jgi:hypothetical protein
VGEARPLGPVLVPTVEHELVQGAGAAHGCGQPVPLLHRADDLQAQCGVQAVPPSQASQRLCPARLALTSRLVMFQ